MTNKIYELLSQCNSETIFGPVILVGEKLPSPTEKFHMHPFICRKANPLENNQRLCPN